jgi:hypothetical protein
MDDHYGCDFFYGYWHRGERLCVPRRFDMNAKLPVASHQTMFFKRSVLGNQRYDERYKIAADFKFGAEYLKKAECPVMADFCVADFAPNGISHRKFMRAAIESFNVRRDLKSISFAENCIWSTMGAVHGALRYYLPGVAHDCQEGFKKLRSIGGRPSLTPVQHNTGR